MYAVRHLHIPAKGKAQQLRAALEEHTKASNAEGGSYSVSQELYSPEGAFINLVTYDSLAAIDEYNASRNPERLARITKIGELVERRWMELHEWLLPPEPTGEFNYVLRINYSPQMGKGSELRKILAERVRSRYPFSGNVGAGLTTRALGEGQELTVNVLFPNLAGLEEFRNANQTEASFQASQAKVVALLGKPGRQELLRVLMR